MEARTDISLIAAMTEPSEYGFLFRTDPQLSRGNGRIRTVAVQISLGSCSSHV
ncbi:hypothetical protein OIDMADRAFT_20752, partial [Oidiodendron maius Zn]